MCRYGNRNGFDWMPPSLKPLEKMEFVFTFSPLYLPGVHISFPLEHPQIWEGLMLWHTPEPDVLRPPRPGCWSATSHHTQRKFPICFTPYTDVNIQRRKPFINVHHILICDTWNTTRSWILSNLVFIQLINYYLSRLTGLNYVMRRLKVLCEYWIIE